MVHLSNGHEFAFCCASGALGFTGDGYFWEQPLRWLGILRPSEFTIITKTVTATERAGNLKMWCPWRCVRLIPGGAVNAVGLTNMGYERWIDECYPKIVKRGYSAIASIQPTTVLEAKAMARGMSRCTGLKGVEINLSCPNTADELEPVAFVQAIQDHCIHPVIVKLGMDSLYLIQRLSPYVEAFDLINTIPWGKVHPDTPSPLAQYGLVGGVSGRPISEEARYTLKFAKQVSDRPIISGGGVDNLDEVLIREHLGASAISFGTVFLRSPWRPNRIIREYCDAVVQRDRDRPGRV